MKKFLAALLAVLVFMEIIPMQFMPVIQAAPKVETEEYSSDFIKSATKLMNENWEDDYFSVITMEIGDSHMLIDGEEKESEAVVESDGELSFPLEDIAEQIGAEVESDGKKEESPKENNRSVELPMIMRGEMRQDSNGEEVPYRIMEEENSEVLSEVEHSKEETEEALGVNIEVNENEVIITKPYQTKQVVLKVSEGKKLDNTQNAKQSVTDGNGLYLLLYETEEDTKNAYEQFLNRNDLEYVTINKVMHRTGMNWGTDRISSDSYKEHLKSNNIEGEELLVGVVDSGVDHTHSELEGRVRTDLAYDFVDGDTVAEDVDGHGTHVSGIIADCSTDNVKIIPIKVLNDNGYGTFLAVAMGISHAVTNGAKVVNLSLAGDAWDDNDVDYQAVKDATEKGVLCVAAAGNSSSDTKYFTPARSPYAVTVAATDQNDLIASFSNYGEAVDIAAPGVGIKSSIPGNNYASWGGTSMSAPHVVAAAAMFLMEEPSLSPTDLKDRLMQSTVDCAMPGKDIEYGAGVLDFRVYLGDKVEPTGLKLNVETIDGSTSPDDDDGWKLNAVVEPKNATDKSVTYTSSDKDVADYKDGIVYAKSEGTAEITAALTNGVSKICTVNVTKSNDWLTGADDDFAGGDGSRENPYLISTAGQLAKLLRDVNVSNIKYTDKYFRQTADIDLDGKNWIPIGYRAKGYTYYPEFEYDGGGYDIKNMKIESSKSFVGLFALNGRALKNINLVDADINGYSHVGGIAGNNLGVIANCYVGGTLEGREKVGAITGVSYNVNFLLIMDCNSDATVKSRASTNSIGGLVGVLGSDIYNSYFTGKVEGLNGHGGGIAGNFDSWNKKYDYYDIRNDENFEGLKFPYKIVNCFAHGNLVDKKEVGLIINSYYTADSPTLIDESPDLTEAVKKPASFFTEESTYNNQSNWYEFYPWNMTASWSMVEGQLPKLRKPVYGSGNPDFSYRELNGYIEITKYKGSAKDVIIPEEINQKPVISIDWYGFEGKAAASVENIFIPKSMININEYALTDTPSLLNINVDPENPMYSSVDGILYSKDLSTLISYPAGRADTSFTIPSSVKTTGSYAFTRTKLTEVHMSENLETMHPGTFFYNKNLEKVIFNGDAPKKMAVTAIDQLTRPVLYYMEGKEGFRGTRIINCDLRQVVVGNIEGSPASGIVDAGTKVTLKTTINADIYYTTDGTEPTKSSTKYEEPITLNEETVLKAVTIDGSDTKGDIATFRYKMSYIPQTPEITEQPTDLLLPYGEQALLSVNAKVDKGYLKYQWYKINRYGAVVKMDGATKSTVDVSASNGQTLRYYCVITNFDVDSGSKNGVSITSRTADAGVMLHYKDPTSQTVDFKSSAFLEVRGTIYVGEDNRSHELSYQWYKTKEYANTGGTKIEGANQARFKIPTEKATKAQYYCVIKRTYETADGTNDTLSYHSKAAEVTVKNEDGSEPIIVGNIEADPGSGTVDAGTKITLDALINADIYYTTDGTEPTKASAKYEEPITVNEETVIKAVTVDSNDVIGDVATFHYKMSYIPETPEITEQPKDVFLPYKEPAPLTVNAKVDKGELKYQWYKIDRDGAEVKVNGATQATFDASVNNGATYRYYCVITNHDKDSGSKEGTSIRSREAEVGILLHYKDPTSLIVEYKSDATLEVKGTLYVGDDQRTRELSYQWYKTEENTNTGGTKIEGATQNRYKAPTDKAGKTYYYCVTDRTYETSEGTENRISYKSKTASVIVNEEVIIENVEANPAGGFVDAGTEITLATTSIADIYYTTDRMNPTKSSTKYEGPITINKDTVLKAIAIDSNGIKSEITTFQYKIRYIPETPEITEQPKDLFLANDEQALLTVNAKVDKGNLTYQWYKVNMDGVAVKVDGAIKSTFDASNSNGETYRYYCVITNHDLDSGSGEGASINSRTAEVGVLRNYKNPESKTIEFKGSAILNVQGTIYVGDNNRSDELSYQWYKTEENTNTGGTKIEGATQNEYKAPSDKAGKTYYYCVINRTYETSEGTDHTLSYNSKAASVIVDEEVVIENVEADPASGIVDAGTKITLKTTSIADIYYTTDETSPTKSSTKYEGPITIDKETVIKAVAIDRNDVKSDVTTFHYKISYIPETPEITEQPKDVFLPYKEPAPLTVNAKVDKGNLTYQWYKIDRDGAEVKVNGATQATFDASVNNGATYRYYCVITNHDKDSGSKEGTSIRSREVEVGILLHYTDPTSLIVEYKSDATLEVKGTLYVGDDQRTRELSYQWYKTEENTNTGGTKIEGATQNRYKAPTDKAGKTYYYCVTDRTYETSEGTENRISYNSNVAYVMVNDEVIIEDVESSHESGFVEAGTKITLKTTSIADIYYTTDETEPTKSSTKYEQPLTINKDTVIKAVAINSNNIKGNITTFHYKISYIPEIPEITEQPTDVFLPFEEQAMLTVDAKVNKGELTYQWYQINRDGAEVKMNGATQSTFDASNNNGATYRYYCVITNYDTDSGSKEGVSIKSRTAEVGVLLHYQNPTSQTVEFKGSATLNVQGRIYVGDDERTRELSYQWYKTEDNTNLGGTKLEGANQNEYKAPTDKAGKTYYYCVISRTYETSEGTKNTITYKSKPAYVNVNQDNNKEVPVSNVVKPVENFTAQSISYNSIKLKWSKSSKVTGYELWRTESKSGKYKLHKKVTSKNTSTFTDTKCVTGKTYYYKIRAYTVSNKKTVYSKYSKVISKKAELSKPSLTRVKNTSKKTVKLEWKKLKGASGYEVYRAATKNGKYKLIKTSKGQGYSFTDRTVVKNKSYYYKIRACRKVGNKTVRSPYSAVKMVKVTK